MSGSVFARSKVADDTRHVLSHILGYLAELRWSRSYMKTVIWGLDFATIFWMWDLSGYRTRSKPDPDGPKRSRYMLDSSANDCF